MGNLHAFELELQGQSKISTTPTETVSPPVSQTPPVFSPVVSQTMTPEAQSFAQLVEPSTLAPMEAMEVTPMEHVISQPQPQPQQNITQIYDQLKNDEFVDEFKVYKAELQRLDAENNKFHDLMNNLSSVSLSDKEYNLKAQSDIVKAISQIRTLHDENKRLLGKCNDVSKKFEETYQTIKNEVTPEDTAKFTDLRNEYFKACSELANANFEEMVNYYMSSIDKLKAHFKPPQTTENLEDFSPSTEDVEMGE